MSVKPLSDEELEWLRGLRAIPLEGDERAYRHRLLATIDALKGEVERYEERERHFANALKVADGGQYRADWDGAIARVISERDALKASNAALKLEQTEARRIIQETGDELERLRSEVARLRGERDGLAAAARALVNHWDEYGPECGLDDVVERVRKTLADDPAPKQLCGLRDDTRYWRCLRHKGHGGRCGDWGNDAVFNRLNPTPPVSGASDRKEPSE